MEKGEITLNKQFLLFSQCFQKTCCVSKDWFLRVCRTSVLKTLWEKEKLLETSNFFFIFSTAFSTCLENFQPFSSYLKLPDLQTLSLEEFKIFHLGEG